MTTYVAVPVPEDRVTEVYGLLSVAPKPSEDQVGGEPADRGRRWDEAALREYLAEASDTIKGLAKYLAERPGQEVTTEEVASELGLPHGWNSLAGALGAWGRKIGNRGFDDFPWESWWGTDGHTRMRMSPEVAEIVRKLL